VDNTDRLRIFIFDLDGVITSEKKYWNTAILTVWELIYSQEYLGMNNYFCSETDLSKVLQEMGEQVIPSSFIYELKSRAINSNWDLTFFVFCLHLVGILSELNKVEPDGWREILKNAPVWEKLQQLGGKLRDRGYNSKISEGIIAEFWQETESLTGNAVLEYLGEFIDLRLGVNVPALAPKGDIWQLCYGNFQEWYEGKKDYQLLDDETVLELSKIEATLKELCCRYSLAIATGRPRTEAIGPLQALGLLEYFDPKRIVTYDEVLAAESLMSQKGKRVKLGKPHPFVVLKAMDPYINVEALCNSEYQQSDHKYAAYIGDAASDVVAAKGAGCMAIGVLTGFATGEARENKRRKFAELGCDAILNSIVELPEWLEHRSRSLTQEVSTTEEVSSALPEKEPDLSTDALGLQERKDMVNQHVKSLSPKVAGPPKADNAIRLDKGELPYPPSRHVIEAIASAARTINRYPDILGGELRGALAKYTKGKPEQIIIGNGSDDLIELIVKTFVQPGEEVLLPVPTFFVYWSSTEIINARPVFVQRTADFGLDVEALLQKVTPQTKVLFIANPNNPTANLVARETIIQILDFSDRTRAERADCMVVVDECYYEICQETVADLVDKYSHLIVLRSFSKSFGLAGLRVGYAIANEVIVDYLYRAAQLFPVSKLALVGAIAALEEISYVEANLDQIRQERGKLGKALQQLGFIVYPSATNFLFVRTEPLGITSKDLVGALQEKNIFVADFGGKPGLDEYYFRTAVGTRTENQRLINGLQEAIEK